MRRSLGVFSVVVSLLVLDSANARKADARHGMPAPSSDCVELATIPARRCIAPAASAASPLPPAANQPQLAAIQSDDWQQFIRKNPLGALTRPIRRGLESIGGAEAPSTRRRSRAPAATPAVAPADIQPADLPKTEQVPVPIPRPLPEIVDEKRSPPIPATASLAATGAFATYAVLVVSIGLPLLVLGAVASSWRRESRRRRSFAISMRAIRNSIAHLAAGEDAFRIGVQDVLGKIETLFQLRSTSVITICPASWEIERAYASTLQPFSCAKLVEEALSELRKRGKAPRDQMLWRYPKSPRRGLNGLRSRSRTKPDAISSMAWVSDSLGVLLVAECTEATSAILRDETQALHHITQLLALAIEGKSRNDDAANTREASRNARELAGRVAHEFKNVLTSITGYAEMAADALNPGSSPHRYVENIQKAGHRARTIIEQTLESSHQNEDSSASFDAVRTVDEIMPELQMCVPSPIRVHALLPGLPIRIQGEPAKLQQILINLVKNAGEAMKTTGTVTVSVSSLQQTADRTFTHGSIAPGTFVRLSVADDGPGIPEADAAQIFEPYFTTKSGSGGTGLGLPVVHQTVLELGGAMDLWTRPGLGTRFDLFFPCLADMSKARGIQAGGDRPRDEASGDMILARSI
ncbi:ATP-binding protein [Rhizobium puerariae]|uniref:histidine kinase n=1 Tax=Rhizobium puerariae TaxID=1585791 RepID=A0ABV6ARC8_9HYPH